MSLELPRADDLRVVRSICHYVAARASKDVEVRQLQKWLSQSVASKAGGWRRSRAYHYTSAAFELGLLERGSHSKVRLTVAGKKMVVCHRSGNPVREDLNERERSLFKQLLPRYQAVRRYLAFYMPQQRPPESIDEFVTDGKPITLVKASDKRFRLTTANSKNILIARTQKVSFAWTLFNWLRMLEVVDDVYKERPDSFFLKQREERLFYPVRHHTLTLQKLRRILLKEARRRGGRVTVIYLPELLAEVCASCGIPKRLFMMKLVELFEQDPTHFYLEMMSSLRSDVRCRQHHRYSNFPKVDGVLRSHLYIRKEG